MRPVNLIPPEERCGERTAGRTGPLPYILVGVLCLALGGIALLTQTENKIDKSKADVTRLRADVAATSARADELAPYTSFQTIAAQRKSTVTSLADSRFNWQRVVRELALVLPPDIQLVSLKGTVRPDVVVGAGESVPTRASVSGPALELIGCAPSQDDVADLISSLHDIDGVTRIGVQKSALPDNATSASSSDGSGENCQTKPSVAKFEIVAAFDAAPVPPPASGVDATVTTTAPDAAASTGDTASADTSSTATGG